jgi:sugar lactone lactonase YvrE
MRLWLCSWCIGSAAVLVAASGSAASDAFEPDANPSQAHEISPSTSQVHTLFPAGDIDWVTFSVTDPSVAIIEAESNFFDPPLLLTTSLGRTVTLDTGGAGVGVSRVQAVLTPGNYYLRVNNAGSAAVGEYTLALLLFSAPEASPEFRFSRLWPLEQQRQDFTKIGAIAITADASVLIAESEFDAVQKFTQDGQFLTQFGPGIGSPGRFDDAQGLTSLPDGRIFISDTGNSQVHRFSPQGAWELSWGDGLLSEPQGITHFGSVLNGFRLFVADSAQGLVFVFNETGAQVVTPFSPVVAPTAMATGTTGVFVLDPPASSGVVTALTEGGVFNGSFGLVGQPRALTVDENGRVLLGYEVNSGGVAALEIDRYSPGSSTPDNDFSLTVPLRAGFGADVALGADKRGALYIVEKDVGTVQKYQIRTNPPQLVNIWGQNDNEDGRFLRPRGVAVARDGSLIVADSGNHRIQVFGPSGEFLLAAGIQGDALGEFNIPSDVAVDEAGNIYVADARNNRIQVLDAALQPLFAFGGFGVGPGQLNSPAGLGLAYSAQEELLVYVADTGNDRIQLFDGSGAWKTTLGGPGVEVGEFDSPADVAVGPDGSVYVADRGNGRIQRFFPGTDLPAAAWLVGDVSQPESVYVETSGLVYVADSNNHRVLLYTAWGSPVGSLGQRGTAPAQFRSPSGLAGDGAGHIFVSDTLNHRIQEFALRIVPAPSKRAVLVAGAGPILSGPSDNPIWDPTVNSVNLAYRALRHQGYAKDEIRLLSGGQSYDIDGDGVNDDFEFASADTLDIAFDWLAQAENALFYIVGNSDDAEIFLNSSPEVLTPQIFGVLLEKLRGSGIVKKTLAIIDTPDAGAYLGNAQQNEVIITSCEDSAPAYFLTKGTISFSSYFWLGVFNGLSFRQAFNKARGDLADAVDYQVPQFNDGADGAFFDAIDFVDEIDFREQRPVLGQVAPVQTLALTDNTLVLQAGDIFDDGSRLIRVWAIITKPSDIPGPGQAVFNRPHIDLIPFVAGVKGGEEEFGGEFDGADEEGVYKIDYFSMDENGNVSQGESGFGVKSGEAPGTMNFTVRRQGTATAITNATVCITPPLVPCEESNVDGIYSVLVLATQNYGVTISAEGYAEYDASLLLQAGTTGSTIIQLAPDGSPGLFHSADYNPANNIISLQELLRVIQFFNLFDLHCEEAGEDGYAPGVGDTGCTPHSSDYNPQNWKVSLQELLRLIQFFNFGGYHADGSGEDGFLPGLVKNIESKQSGGLTGNVQLAQDGPFAVDDPLDVTISLDYDGAEPISSLGLIMNMPAGFAFDSVVSGTRPDGFQHDPADNTLQGFWIVPPTFPTAFTYRLRAQEVVATAPEIGGRALYRTGGPEMQALLTTCTPPATPGGVTASQNLSDRVEVAWNAVPGATAYRVFRSQASNFGQAQPISNWISGTAFSDTTALAPVEQEGGGCSSPPPPDPVRYFYWVVARSSESCEGNPGGGVQGFRAVDSKAMQAGLTSGSGLGDLLVTFLCAGGVILARRRRLVHP